MCGSGAESAGAASGGAGVVAGDSDCGGALAVALVPLVQAAAVANATATSSCRQIFNHRRHGETQGKVLRTSISVSGRFMVFPVMIFPCDPPWILRVLCG